MRRLLSKFAFLGISLFPLIASAASWQAMDWIDGDYERSTPSWQQQLHITQATINCKDLNIRTTPATCISWILANPVSGISQFVPYVDPNPTTFQANAALYSALTLGTPVSEIDLDDFFTSYASWYASKKSGTSAFLNQAITNLKSVNHNLKFGITLYENELDPTANPYIDNTHLSSAVKAKFDVVRLFLHYRANGPQYASYVSQAKSYFPNAQIVAGVYPYDRIDDFPCSQQNSVPCTSAQELSYFQQALNIQVQLLQQGGVTAMDCFPGWFGDETDLFGSGTNSDHLTCNNTTRCVNNTISMRGMIQSAYAGFAGGAPTITSQPQDTVLLVGQSQTFRVAATGTSPLTYLWKKNGLTISGAASASYTTPPATKADNQSTYVCFVNNAHGTDTSRTALMTVGSMPTITQQPTNASVLVGQTETFRVAASGTSPLTYLWKKNGITISGATAANYTTPPATMSDNQSTYVAFVTNAYGTATSHTATLTVAAQASSEQLSAQAVQVFPNPWRSDRHTGKSITFSHVAPGSIVQIFTISAHLVKSLSALVNSVAWDQKNDTGDRVASGIYIYLVTDEGGHTVHGQLAIIN